MHERGESVEDGHGEMAALEANGVADRVAVHVHRHDGGVHQPHVDIGQAGLPRDLLHGLLQRLLLHLAEHTLDLGHGQLLRGSGALDGGGGRQAFGQLAGHPDDSVTTHHTGHLLGLLERQVAVLDHGLDVGDQAVLHVELTLWPAAHAQNLTAPVHDDEHKRLGDLSAHVQDRIIRAAILIAVALERKLDREV